MGAGARLELREDVADVRLDRLLGQEQPLADLAVHEAVGDELEHLDLPHRRLLLQLPKRALERDDLCGCAVPSPGRDRVEAARMAGVAVEDLFALCCVHGLGIGGSLEPPFRAPPNPFLEYPRVESPGSPRTGGG